MRHTLSFLNALVGRRITRLARVLYEVRGQLNVEFGPLEIGTDGGTFLLDSDGDGERLRVLAQAWEDPFTEPLSEENQRFIDECGKWTRVDVTHDREYRDLVGERVTGVVLVENEHGLTAGVRLCMSVRDVWFLVSADECYVRSALPVGFVEVTRGDSPQ